MRIMTESPQTIPEHFARTVAQRGDHRALGAIRGGELRWRTWREVADDAARLAETIAAAGIQPGDRVAHVSENRYEWIITDLALHLAGAVHVPQHVTLSPSQIAEQITDSGARLVFVSNRELLAKFAELLPTNVAVLIHDELNMGGHGTPSRDTVNPLADVNPDDLTTILYTSGTTGRPRGVMLSQRNLASNAAAVCDVLATGIDQTRLCVLPLSHIYARTCDLYSWVCLGSRLVLAESRETLMRDCQLVRPNGLNAVPFLYQRIAEGVRSSGASDPGAALRAAFGGQIEWLFSGGAPLAPDVEAWFAESGLPVHAGYGLTEASPVISMSTQANRRLGSVGQPIPDIEVRIADDGEVLTRGPHVMQGYWHNAAATDEVIRDGWLHTGDLGELDGDGFLKISGRKKELIVLSTGKKVSPTRVENLLTASPLIEQAAVFGEGQCGLVALVRANCERLDEKLRSAEQGARSKEKTRQVMADEIERSLAAASHEEQVHRFALLDRPFSIEQGELTPKMSLCRTVIARNFAAELAEAEPQRPKSNRES
jgi:long-chain acyl-CoA synthetase